MECKVRVLKHLEGVFTSLQPEVGKTYDAVCRVGRYRNKEIAVIKIKGKLVALRQGEYERVEE